MTFKMAAPMSRVGASLLHHIKSRLSSQVHNVCCLHQLQIQNFKNSSYLYFCNNTVQNVFTREVSSSTISLLKKKESAEKVPKPIKQDTVLVFNAEGTLVGKMLMSKADEMARKDGLKLLDIGINQDKVQCFKLLTGKEYFEESMKKKTQKATEKLPEEKEFRMTASISDHDLSIKLAQIRSSLDKGKQVKISVKGNRRLSEGEVDKLQSAVLKNVSDKLQDLAIVKKATKSSGFLTFQLVPQEKENKD